MPGMGLGSTATGAATGAAVGGPPGAVVGAAAGLAGDALSYFGGKGAARTQERMANEALRYQREIEAQRRREYEERQRLERERQDELDRRRAPYRQASRDLLTRWGYAAPEQEMMSAAAAPPGGLARMPSRGTLGELARS